MSTIKFIISVQNDMHIEKINKDVKQSYNRM